MPEFARISAELTIPEGGGRVRIGSHIAEAWGVQAGDEPDCTGFFRQREELLCVPNLALNARERSPLGRVLALKNAHSGSSNVADLADLPDTIELIAPDRLIEFKVKWISGNKQLDLHLSKAVIERLRRTPEERDIRVLTWMGWLVLMSVTRYDEHLREYWPGVLRAENALK